MFYLLQTDFARKVTDVNSAGSYFPVGLQILFAVGLIVFLVVVTHLLGPKRKTTDKLQNFASGIESHGDARQPMAIKYFLVAILFVLFDVEEISTHGGSLRIYAKHKEDTSKEVTGNVSALLKKEADKGLNNPEYYNGFQPKALKVKIGLIEFLINCKKAGKKVAAYGAAAKGNTLLNYCGIKNDLIDYVVDANPHKQNKWLPASHIPVVNEDHLKNDQPDYIIILPWNLKDEITQQLSYIKQWGGQFIVPIPQLEVIQ